MRSRQLLASFEVHRKLPVNYDTMHESKTAFIRPSESFPEVTLFEIEQAYVSPYGVVFKNGRVQRDSVYGMFDPKKQWPTFIKKILTGKTKNFEGNVLVAHHAFYENYFHWLCEIMPRLFVSLNALKNENVSILMHEKQPDFVRQYLSLFGVNIITVRDDELLKAQRVYFPSQIARPLAYHEQLLREMSAWLREKLIDPASTHTPEKIFISRKNARYRITHHESEIEAFLHTKGFVSILPEQYTVKEQANIFKNARYIIGSHGAGFSNLLFAPGCELIVDIIHKEHPQDCFYNLANVFGTGCYYFQCEGTGKLTYKNNDDVVADVQEFIRSVGPLIQ